MKSHKWSISFALCCLLILASAVSCHDKQGSPADPEYCTENPGQCKSVLEAKDYFAFKVGSYWVYEEETSHERDSLYVIQATNDENGYSFFTYIKSSLTDYEYRYWPSYYGSGISGCNTTGGVFPKCLYVNRSKGKFQNDLGESEVFFINYKIGESISTGTDMDHCPYNHLKFVAQYESYLVANESFENVLRIDQNCEFAEGKQPTKFYYSKNIGIIRKELIDSNQVWNLVNYSIIQ